jgi:hypothetical protein
MSVTENIGSAKRARKTEGGQPPSVDPRVEAWKQIPTDIRPIAPEYPTRTKDKVAIVGFADGHRDQAPFDNPDYEIWGLNRLHSAMPDKRWTRWFEIHDIAKFYMGEKPDKEHLEFLRTFPGPIYLRPQDMELPNLACPSKVAYPLQAVLRDFGNYMTNSISWMLALAIGMRFRVIELYGVDMAQDQLFSAEYRQQRPSCEYLIGVAQGRGILVGLPAGSDLLKSDHLYGIDEGSPIMLKALARMQELGKRKDVIRQQMSKLEQEKAAFEQHYSESKLQLVAAINQMDGAQQEIQYRLVNLSSPPEEAPPAHLR